MFASPYRRFHPGAAALDGGLWSLESTLGGAGAQLDETDYALARLFDGQRDAVAVRSSAQATLGLDLSPHALEGFVANLAIAGLMQPGRLEPLPVPATSDREVRELGWDSGTRRMPDTADDAPLPPSTVAGSRNNPGFAGGLTGRIRADIGRVDELDATLRPQWLVALGRPLLWPLASRLSLGLFLALVVAALAAAYNYRLEWVDDVRASAWGLPLLWRLLLGAYFVNLFASAARAAAIARYTPELPRVGVVLGFGFLRLPRLVVDTSGAAERATRADRMRIVGAGMVGTAALLALSVLVWFLTRHTEPTLAHHAVMVATVASSVLVFRLNPLAQFDGYFLLCNALGHLDLRAQAIAAVFGYTRPWLLQGRNLSRRTLVLYAVTAWLFWAGVMLLVFGFLGSVLVERYRGIGFLFVVALVGVLMQKQYIRSGAGRSSLGRPKSPNRLTRRWKIVLGVLAVVALIPYPYAPSGDFEVLPLNRADIRALAAGDVREVLVKEGDAVTADQPIARLDDSAARARIAESEAERARLQADLALAQKGAKAEEIEVARQRVATAQSAANLASQQAARIATAYQGKSVTPQEYERARGAADVARQQLLEAQRALALVVSPAQDERLKALQADVKRVEAELAYRQQELAWATITAPIAGRIVSSKLQFARGNFLNRGELLATVEDSSELLAEIKLPEAVMSDVAVGTRARVKFWAYPGSTFGGTVKAIAPAAETGPYGRVVRVQMVVEDPEHRLRTGMTGNAKVDAGWHLTAVVFTRALVRFVLVEVWSWLP